MAASVSSTVHVFPRFELHEPQHGSTLTLLCPRRHVDDVHLAMGRHFDTEVDHAAPAEGKAVPRARPPGTTKSFRTSYSGLSSGARSTAAA